MLQDEDDDEDEKPAVKKVAVLKPAEEDDDDDEDEVLDGLHVRVARGESGACSLACLTLLLFTFFVG